MVHPLGLETRDSGRFVGRTFQRSPMIVVLSTGKIRNLGIVDSWIDLGRRDIAMHEGVLSVVEKAHSRRR